MKLQRILMTKKLYSQRNHTLFGSVWSSMRKQKPFSRNRMLKSSINGNNNNNNNNAINNNTISLATSTAHNMTSTAVALTSDYQIDNNKANNAGQRLTEGLNNITKSIMQQRGVQLEAQDDIPLRPLLLNGSQTTNGNSNSNNNQLQPKNEWVNNAENIWLKF